MSSSSHGESIDRPSIVVETRRAEEGSITRDRRAPITAVLPSLLVVLLFLAAARCYDTGAMKVASSLALVGAAAWLVQRVPSRRWFVDRLGASGGGEGSGRRKRRKTAEGLFTDGSTIDEGVCHGASSEGPETANRT